MKTRNRFFFTLSAIIIIALAYLLSIGQNFGPNWRFYSAGEKLKLGLDLQGGAYVEMEAVDPNPKAADMERAKQMLELRVNTLGVSEATVSIAGGNRIRIEVPGIKNSDELLAQVGRTGRLTFKSPDEIGRAHV